jgi:uncharacterized lipoprotein
MALLIALMAACGEATSTEEEETPADDVAPTEEAVEEDDTEEAEDVIEEVADNDWETQVGETTENEGGSHTLIARNDQVDTQETGPMILNVTQVNAISSQLKGEVADLMETDAIEYIQIDMEVENTSEDTITFYPSQATITTNTGEQLEADMWLSDHIDGDFIGAVKKSGSQFFILENSNAEDIEWVRILINAPHDADWNDVGEELDFQVEL